MEYILPRRRIYSLITFQTIIFLVLCTNRLAAEPIWIWTKGCFQVKEEVHSKVFNMSNNLPHTCFHTCGPQSMAVSLQGNVCRCEPKSKRRLPSPFCTPCEHNSMVTCGNSERGYWSLYEKAKQQNLAEHGIPMNATGCVVNNQRHYRVENCNNTGFGSLCTSALTRTTHCDRDAGKWSLSCSNAFDNLVTSFVGRVQGCRKEYWIGLFSIDEPLSHSMLSDYPQLSLTPTSSFQAESSVLLGSVTDQVPLNVTNEPVEVMFSSSYDTYVHTEPLSTHLTLVAESSETHSRKVLSILPTKHSFTSTSMTSIVPSRTDTYRASSESSFHISALSSQRTEMDGISTAAVLASSTVTLVPQQISPTPSFITQKYSSETNLVVAVAVVGAIAAFSLAATGVMFVYMKRSLSNLKKTVNRKTTFTDDPPHQSRDSSLEGFDENLQRNNTYSDLQETSFCPRTKRSDFRSHAYRPPFLFNNIRAMENEYVLY